MTAVISNTRVASVGVMVGVGVAVEVGDGVGVSVGVAVGGRVISTVAVAVMVAEGVISTRGESSSPLPQAVMTSDQKTEK